MADLQILATGVEAAPSDVVIPDSAEIQPKSVRATFNGSGAGSAFLPTLVLVSDAGHEAWRIPTAVPVEAGGSAEVTWAPFLDGRPPGLPVWTDILPTLSLNYDAINGTASGSFARAMVQAAAPGYTVLLWLRIVVTNLGGPSATPYQILGLPPCDTLVSGDDKRVTATLAQGLSSPHPANDNSASRPAYVDAIGTIWPTESADPQVDATNYPDDTVIFSGFGVYPWNPSA